MRPALLILGLLGAAVAPIGATRQSQREPGTFDVRPASPIEFADKAEAARRLGVTVDQLRRLDQANIFSPLPREFFTLPARFKRSPLPRSTYAAFARARPARVSDGYREADTRFEERIGAYQLVGGRYWFGKTFYDGEGSSGVGAIGSLDRAGRYAWLRIPELFEWSVDSLFVEDSVIWAGRVSHPEGDDRSGGLLQYDRQTHRVTIHDVPAPIHSIARAGGALFLGTSTGVRVLRRGTWTAYRVEPDTNGRYVLK